MIYIVTMGRLKWNSGRGRPRETMLDRWTSRNGRNLYQEEDQERLLNRLATWNVSKMIDYTGDKALDKHDNHRNMVLTIRRKLYCLFLSSIRLCLLYVGTFTCLSQCSFRKVMLIVCRYIHWSNIVSVTPVTRPASDNPL